MNGKQYHRYSSLDFMTFINILVETNNNNVILCFFSVNTLIEFQFCTNFQGEISQNTTEKIKLFFIVNISI